MRFLLFVLLFSTSLQLVSSLTALQEAGKGFWISFVKHLSQRNPEIFHRDFQVKIGDRNFNYNQFAKVIREESDKEVQKMRDLYKDMLTYSHYQWEQEFKNFDVKVAGEGLIDFKGPGLTALLKHTRDIEGDYKVIQMVMPMTITLSIADIKLDIAHVKLGITYINLTIAHIILHLYYY
ncbi:unnamed protein product [Caenorhabditis angaria]|uniref:Uncharacterized protein n=1 Tax=Caenorhabditis angaria TaxID=860376 RepID=A0A9P1N0H6_9PELO|nr:unnamed protein product [Caenorhabditis angaria]